MVVLGGAVVVTVVVVVVGGEVEVVVTVVVVGAGRRGRRDCGSGRGGWKVDVAVEVVVTVLV